MVTSRPSLLVKWKRGTEDSENHLASWKHEWVVCLLLWRWWCPASYSFLRRTYKPAPNTSEPCSASRVSLLMLFSLAGKTSTSISVLERSLQITWSFPCHRKGESYLPSEIHSQCPSLKHFYDWLIQAPKLWVRAESDRNLTPLKLFKLSIHYKQRVCSYLHCKIPWFLVSLLNTNIWPRFTKTALGSGETFTFV